MPTQPKDTTPKSIITKINDQTGCDSIDIRINRPQNHINKSAPQVREPFNSIIKKEFCNKEKIIEEEDEDSGIELGPFSFQSQKDDAAVVGK